MAENDDSEIQNILKALSAKKEEPVDRAACPAEETLVDYLEGELTEVQRTEVHEHLVSCTLCIGELIAAGRNSPAPDGEVPQALIDDARRLVPEDVPQSISFDLVVRLAGTSLELLHTTGRAGKIEGQPVSLRGKPEKEAGALQVESNVGGFNVALYVEHAEEELCDVVVGITSPGAHPAEGMRVSLYSADRERASNLTKGGRVVFDRLTRGKYTLPISGRSTLIGIVRLEIA